MDRHLPLELVRVTEAAALAAARLVGRGDEKAADHAAVEAMRRVLKTAPFRGTVVIGEGERDEAPMLFIGEKVGQADGPAVDLALDPLEGTTLCSQGAPNSISVMAIAQAGNFLHAPDTYMDKIAVGPLARAVIDLDQEVAVNLRAIAAVKGVRLQDLTVVILDRPRHQTLIEEVRRLGSRVHLIADGDVSAAIATCKPESGIDVLLGCGGAPEGVIAAAALRCLGGGFQGRLKFRNDAERERGRQMGIHDEHTLYTEEDLARGPVLFCATGVTTGSFLQGVRFFAGGARTSSIVMRSQSGTIREIETEHRYTRELRNEHLCDELREESAKVPEMNQLWAPSPGVDDPKGDRHLHQERPHASH